MQTILITGGNSGLGFETAKKFLAEGFRVIIMCRNQQKVDESIQKLSKTTGKDDISGIVADFTALASIKKAVESMDLHIDILVCNAGISYESLPVRYTTNGIEETFGVNHLAHFYLFQLLSYKQKSISKVFIISSNLHSEVLSKGFSAAPDLSNLELVAYPEKNGVFTEKKQLKQTYPNSKLCNVLFGYELGRRNPETVCNSFNPGFMPSTGLPRSSGAFMRFILKYIFPIFTLVFKAMRTPQQSANDIFYNIAHQKTGGKYLDGRNEINSSTISYDKILARDLWEFSENLINRIA